ncbi:MAG: hypothetical protein WDN06_15570 [Asticcacaulis sp.]
MIVIAQQGLLDVVSRQQLAGDAGILGQHHVGGTQNVERPQGDVAQIADRRGDNIEAGADRLRRRCEQRFHGSEHFPKSVTHFSD